MKVVHINFIEMIGIVFFNTFSLNDVQFFFSMKNKICV